MYDELLFSLLKMGIEDMIRCAEIEGSGTGEDSLVAAEDDYDLKPGERWVTTRNGHHIVINDKHEIVHASPYLMRKLDRVRGGIESELKAGDFRDSTPADRDFDKRYQRTYEFRQRRMELNRTRPKWAAVMSQPNWKPYVQGYDDMTSHQILQKVGDYLTAVSPTDIQKRSTEENEEMAAKFIGALSMSIATGSGYGDGYWKTIQGMLRRFVPTIEKRMPEFFHPQFCEGLERHHVDEIDRHHKEELERRKKEAQLLAATREHSAHSSSGFSNPDDIFYGNREAMFE